MALTHVQHFDPDGLAFNLLCRGDKAFCSTECRSQQILLDERLENCTVAALKSNSGAPSSHQNRVVASGTAAAA